MHWRGRASTFARPNACYAMELMIDAIARRVGREPYEVRLANLVRPEQMPFDKVSGSIGTTKPGKYTEVARFCPSSSSGAPGRT